MVSESSMQDVNGAGFATSRRLQLRRPPYDAETLKNIENTAFTGLSPRNLRLTLAHHPELGRHFQAMAHVVLFKSKVNLRTKEIAIMRTGALTRSEYVWGMHVSIFGERVGLTAEALEDLTMSATWQDLDSDLWSNEERLAVRMVDELHHDSCISDETWKEMQAIWPPDEFLELIFASGVYHLASFFLNSAGVPLEDGQARFPLEKRRTE